MAQTLYVTPDQLTAYGLHVDQAQLIDPVVLQKLCEDASSLADGYLRSQGYPLPLDTWDGSLTRNCAHVVIYDAMCILGFNPEGGDANYKDRKDAAIRWFIDVSRGVFKIATTSLTAIAKPCPPIVRTTSRRDPNPPRGVG